MIGKQMIMTSVIMLRMEVTVSSLSANPVPALRDSLTFLTYYTKYVSSPHNFQVTPCPKIS